MSEMDLTGYVWTDTNGDGYGDNGWADLNGDGAADAWAFDSSLDGSTDQMAWDTNGDGVVDTVTFDSDASGDLDSSSWDTDGNGQVDTVAGPATGGAAVVSDTATAPAQQFPTDAGYLGGTGPESFATGYVGGGGAASVEYGYLTAPTLLNPLLSPTLLNDPNGAAGVTNILDIQNDTTHIWSVPDGLIYEY